MYERDRRPPDGTSESGPEDVEESDSVDKPRAVLPSPGPSKAAPTQAAGQEVTAER